MSDELMQLRAAVEALTRRVADLEARLQTLDTRTIPMMQIGGRPPMLPQVHGFFVGGERFVPAPLPAGAVAGTWAGVACLPRLSEGA